jgi:hypothetical protein
LIGNLVRAGELLFTLGTAFIVGLANFTGKPRMPIEQLHRKRFAFVFLVARYRTCH